MNTEHQKKHPFLIMKLYVIILLLFTGQSNGSVSVAVHRKLPGPYYHSQKSHKVTNKNTSLNQKDTKDNLLTSEDSNSAIWSNAFNFKGAWGANVDQRTGVLTAHFKAGSLLSNVGHGPNIDLQINYNSNVFSDPDGIGRGWSWNLTHFTRSVDQLTTSGGQNFYLHQLGKNHWKPLYHKLNDIKIDGDKSTWFTITYANGLRETLNHDGYEIRLEQQNGWGVNFIYQHGTHLLQSIVDDEGNKIAIVRSSGYLDIISHQSDGKPAVVRIKSYHERPEEITFLPIHSAYNPTIHLNYNQYFFHVIYPSGLKQTFTFDCNNAMKLSLSGIPLRKLCVVAKEEENPGAGQPIIKTRYLYSGANINEHNYLGFGAELTPIAGATRDILFEAPVDYAYRTVKDNDQVREVHTYNKYHLLIDSKLISDHTGKLLSETQNFFCNTGSTDACSQRSFEDLPSTYSLPLKVVTRVWGISSDVPAVTVITREYDHSGRLVRSIDAYGRVTRIQYCPLEGDASCPAAPAGWPFSKLPELVTHYPASSIIQASTPAVILHNTYSKIPNLHGHGYILASALQTRRSDDQYITLTRHYYMNRDNVLTYGLLKKTALTGSPASSQMKSVIYNYYYTISHDGHSETTYSNVELDKNKRQILPSVTTSLFTNKVIQRTDSTGKNITRYHYDIFDRLTKVDIAIKTPFASSLHYQYLFMPEHNQVIITTVNGLQQKIVFDNAGREIMHFDEAISPSGKAIQGQWLLKKSVRYDAYGRDTETDTYTTDTAGKRHTLKTTKDYDDMGRISHVYLPNDETVFMLYDNPDRCMISYRQSNQGTHSVIYSVLGNVLDQPIEKRFFPASLTPIPSIKALCNIKNKIETNKTISTAYDGFGRIITTKDTAGRITRRHYDALGRLDDMTDSSGNHIYQRYNLIGKVTERWALPVHGGRYLLSSAGYNAAGQLLYKAGEDGKKTTFTYTKAGQPATVVTPAGHLFSWKYNVLGLPVARYVDGKVLLQSDYDHITAQPRRKADITGITTWDYSIDGLPKKLIHHGKNGYSDYKILWHYNDDRRVISKTDTMGNLTQTKYDKFGRISALYYQPKNNLSQMIYSPVYDQFSRVNTIHYGSGMNRVIHYDSWGHPQEITDTLVNKLLFHWQFSYDISGNIVSLYQQAENHQRATLKYQYDILDNLVSMHCEGNNNLSLCPRDTAFANTNLKNAPVIVDQHYAFTPLNRISQVRETLQNPDTGQTLSKETAYSYSNATVPLRLQKISTSWNQEVPDIHYFSYDISGNMTTDGEGNKITYNAFNQVTSVIKVNGQKSNYAYDGIGQEVMEHSASGTRYLFYSGKHLINEKISSSQEGTHTIGYHGDFRTINGVVHEYEERNYKGDVVGLLTKAATNDYLYQLSQRNIYSPYGMVWHHHQVSSSLHLQNFLGFDNERTDPATGWQFLGAGHRTYNAKQRYFVSEDSFGDGYAFGNNNPIMNTDPTGNTTKHGMSFFDAFRYAGTLGLGAIHNKWAGFIGSIIMLGLSTLLVSVAIACQMGPSGYTALPFAIGTSVLGVVPVSAVIAPHNKGLQIAAAVMGGIQVLLSTGAIGSIAGLKLTSWFCPSILCVPADDIPETSVAAERGAEYVSEATHQLYEDIELHNINRDAGYATLRKYPSLIQTLQERIPHMITRNENGSYLNLNNYDQVSDVQEAMGVCYDDITTALASAALKQKPLSLTKLQVLLDAKTGIGNTSPEAAFHHLMADFSSYVKIGEDQEIYEYEDFFTPNTSAVVIRNEAKTSFIRPITKELYVILTFSPDSRGYIKTTSEEAAIYFMGEDNKILVTEYFRIEK